MNEFISMFGDLWRGFVAKYMATKSKPVFQSPVQKKEQAPPFEIKPVETRPSNVEINRPRYPAYLEGIPVVNPVLLLEDQADLVGKIISFCDIEVERPGLVHKVLGNYAAAVHLIPASESHHHADNGGLLRHGLEVALTALMVLNEYAPHAKDYFAEQRKQLEPRMRFSVLVAALSHDLGKPVTDVSIRDGSGHKKWNPMKETLYEWAQNEDVDRYFLSWSSSRNKKHEPVSILMMGYVLGQEGRTFIAEVDSSLLSDAVESVSGDPSVSNVIAKVVKRADTASTERDQRRRGSGGSATGSGMPIERYYLDAMRSLIRKNEWKLNKAGAKAWVIKGDLFLVWPAAAQDMSSYFMKNGIKGIPFDEMTILNELGDRGFLRPRIGDDGKQKWIWPIVPNEIRSSLSAPLNAICFITQDVVFDSEMPSIDGLKGSDAVAAFEKQDATPKASVAKPVAEVKKEVVREVDRHSPREEVSDKSGPEINIASNFNNGTITESEVGDVDEIKPETISVESGSLASAQVKPNNKVTASDAEDNFKNGGLFGFVLLALAKNLNNRDPEIPLLKSVMTNSGRILLLRSPEFFAGLHDGEEAMKAEALSSGFIQKTEEGSVEWYQDEQRWWALTPDVSTWFFILITKYRDRVAKSKKKLSESVAKPTDGPVEINTSEIDNPVDNMDTSSKKTEFADALVQVMTEYRAQGLAEVSLSTVVTDFKKIMPRGSAVLVKRLLAQSPSYLVDAEQETVRFLEIQ